MPLRFSVWVIFAREFIARLNPLGLSNSRAIKYDSKKPHSLQPVLLHWTHMGVAPRL